MDAEEAPGPETAAGVQGDAAATGDASPAERPGRKAPSFDRSIVEGPLPRAVWALAWPTIVQNVIGGLQGLVDHAMVGHYVGYVGNAAIGVSWQIFLVVVVFVSSLYSGMGVLVARFAGADDSPKVNRVVYQAFLTSIFLTAAILAPLGYFLAPSLLDLINASPEVRAEALPYLRTMFLFSFGMLFFFMLGGALRAAGDAKTPMRLGVLLTVLNIVLNVILIRGLGPIPAFGTLGAALGTVIASGVVAVISLYLLFGHRLVVQFSTSLGLKPDWKIIGQLFRFGLPTGFQGVAMNIGGVLLLRFVGSLPASAEAQAAYTVGYSQIFSFIIWVAIALLGATAAVAGQNLGAGKPERTRAAPRISAAFGLAVALVLGLSFLVVPRQLFGVFGIEDPAVLALGQQLLAYLSLSGLFISVALAYTGALQGTGDTKSPMWITLASQIVVPLGYCALVQWTWGLEAADIWLAIVLGHFLRALLSVARFHQGKWQSIRVDLEPA